MLHYHVWMSWDFEAHFAVSLFSLLLAVQYAAFSVTKLTNRCILTLFLNTLLKQAEFSKRALLTDARALLLRLWLCVGGFL